MVEKQQKPWETQYTYHDWGWFVPIYGDKIEFIIGFGTLDSSDILEGPNLGWVPSGKHTKNYGKIHHF